MTDNPIPTRAQRRDAIVTVEDLRAACEEVGLTGDGSWSDDRVLVAYWGPDPVAVYVYEAKSGDHVATLQRTTRGQVHKAIAAGRATAGA